MNRLLANALCVGSALYASAGYATVYFNVEQAQNAMLPGAQWRATPAILSDQQRKAIAAQSGVSVRNADVKAWRSATGESFYVDQVLGKHEFITYALLLDKAGTVLGLEVMDYRESYGGQVRDARWRAQFSGKRAGAGLKLDADIKNISSATLSCKHITEGVKRLLATHTLLAAHD
jgi:Na+-transporting NADH:ubiquinone oxidoreductase subunit C